jgi:superfamily II DNA or RNA helicase
MAWVSLNSKFHNVKQFSKDNYIFSQLDLDDTRNQSGINQSLDASSSVINELDVNSKDSWLYPVKNFEKRDYQLNISKSAFFNNTLVILPTGLGKTAIGNYKGHEKRIIDKILVHLMLFL